MTITMTRKFSSASVIPQCFTTRSDAWIQYLIKNGLFELKTEDNISAVDSIRCGCSTLPIKIWTPWLFMCSQVTPPSSQCVYRMDCIDQKKREHTFSCSWDDRGTILDSILQGPISVQTEVLRLENLRGPAFMTQGKMGSWLWRFNSEPRQASIYKGLSSVPAVDALCAPAATEKSFWYENALDNLSPPWVIWRFWMHKRGLLKHLPVNRYGK